MNSNWLVDLVCCLTACCRSLIGTGSQRAGNVVLTELSSRVVKVPWSLHTEIKSDRTLSTIPVISCTPVKRVLIKLFRGVPTYTRKFEVDRFQKYLKAETECARCDWLSSNKPKVHLKLVPKSPLTCIRII